MSQAEEQPYCPCQLLTIISFIVFPKFILMWALENVAVDENRVFTDMPILSYI